MVYDFHTHTFLSDGELLPIELARRVSLRGYGAVAFSDHVSMSNLESVLQQVTRDCRLIEQYWRLTAIPGVEITHVPAAGVAEVARRARELGAALVVVHGETVNEPVEPGTNHAAVTSPDVDILAHPGLISEGDAALAASNGVFLEITTRRGHSLTNGYVVQAGRSAGASFLLNTDAHRIGEFLSEELARNTALGAGLSPDEMEKVLCDNPRQLLARLRPRLQALGLGALLG